MFAVINTIRKPAQRKVAAAMFAPVFNAQPHNDRRPIHKPCSEEDLGI